MPVTLLLGGARSGKSALAVEIGRRFADSVVVIATAQPLDDDMAGRIVRHRAERPPSWTTVEVPIDLAAAVRSAPADALVIVDCVTVWLANLFTEVGPPSHRARSAADVGEALAGRRGPTVVVSNEVGMGIVPEHPLGREFRDELGRINQQIAAIAERTLLMVAGRALLLDDPLRVLT